jgi:hypothetical protein
MAKEKAKQETRKLWMSTRALLDLHLNPEDRGGMFLQTTVTTWHCKPDDRTLQIITCSQIGLTVQILSLHAYL